MTLSLLTAYLGIPANSRATTGLWDRRFETVHRNLDQLNTDAGTSVTSLAGWNKGSITTTLDTSGGTLSVLTIGAASGNTVSLSTWALSASTVSSLHNLVALISTGTVQAYSGNTVQILSHLSLGNKRIENLGEPSNTSDAATKYFVGYHVNAGVSNFIGSWITAVTNVALSDRSVCFVMSTSSMSMADSTNSLKAPVANLFVAIGSSAASSVMTMALPGAAIGGLASLTTGATYFLNTTGGYTTTAPSAQSTIVYALGVAKSAGTLIFAPAYLYSNTT